MGRIWEELWRVTMIRKKPDESNEEMLFSSEIKESVARVIPGYLPSDSCVEDTGCA